MPRGVRALWLLVGLLLCLPVQASHHVRHDGVTSVRAVELPAEVRETLQLIRQGGPFPFSRDGVVFGNYEHRLPKQPRGYYHEYTVKTPGAHGRGARRLVCGQTNDCYYSDDHYQSFQRIIEER